MSTDQPAPPGMDPAADPVVRAALKAFYQAPVNRYRKLGLKQARLFADVHEPGPSVGNAADLAIAGGDRQTLPIRVYRAEAPSGTAIVYLHGGGWALGSVESHDGVCRKLCQATAAMVVSVGYRLAPEHPFPAGLMDAHAAAQWVVDQSTELGVEPARLVLAGDSAGANLAAALCLRIRDQGGPPVALQLLIYPALDNSQEHASLGEHAEAPFLDVADMRWFEGMYARATGAGDPYVWPGLAESLVGLPPAVIQVAESDALRDSGVAYAGRLAAAGVAVELLRYPLYHGFLTITPRAQAARQAIADAAARITDLTPASDLGTGARKGDRQSCSLA